jgi:murein L,D-transpeptidase YcbB/YkuD
MKLYIPKTFPYPKLVFLLLCLPFLMLTQCRRKEVKVERDITITPKNAVTRLLIDSIQMEQFIKTQKLQDSSANRLRNFYNSRNFQFAWLAENGLAEQAKVFYELDKNYISTTRDSTDADQALHERLSLLLGKDTLINTVSPALVDLELTLTQHFFNFINYAYAGKLDPATLQWYIPRRKLDVVALLDSLIAKKGSRLENWEPVNRYYKMLNKELIRWYGIQKRGAWEKISASRKKIYLPGDTGLIITRIKQRLADFGAMSPGDTTPVFNAVLSAGVKKAQKQFGFTESGRIDRTLIAALNIPAELRIQQMLINLERMKWTPLIPESKFILVNIPEYKLHVFESGKEVLNMGIVVGKAASKTVIFSNELKNIVFSPYWNIPPSIVRTEILPEMRKNNDYLAQKNMEQYDTSEGLPLIRQKPGNMNSLGRIKFLFPNSYNIYLHDTPSKSLFAEEKRAFSHGCIRLEQPKKLAEYLLADRPEWNSAKIDKAMNSKTEIWVNMKQPVPVFITYFTSWVDKDGLLHFRDDLYGHDRAMAKQMFKSIESKK